MSKFVPLHMYTHQRIKISDFELDYIYDFFRYGTRLKTMFWHIEYDSIEIDELPQPVNDNHLVRIA